MLKRPPYSQKGNSMPAPVIDTLEVLDAAHKLLKKSISMAEENPAEASRLTNIANAGFSAVIPYLKNRQAPVQKAHHAAMSTLLEASKEVQ